MTLDETNHNDSEALKQTKFALLRERDLLLEELGRRAKVIDSQNAVLYAHKQLHEEIVNRISQKDVLDDTDLKIIDLLNNTTQ